MVEGSHFHIHPVHDHYYDIMLLRLDEPVKCGPSVRPICLPDPRSMKVKTKYQILFTIDNRDFLQNIENEEAILAAAGNNNDWILEYEDIIGTKFKRYDILDSSILQMYEVD